MVAILVLRIWLLVARDSAVCWDPLENYSACVVEFLHLYC